jgi:hypothetical protein
VLNPQYLIIPQYYDGCGTLKNSALICIAALAVGDLAIAEGYICEL